jgi:hypothetical protein
MSATLQRFHAHNDPVLLIPSVSLRNTPILAIDGPILLKKGSAPIAD